MAASLLDRVPLDEIGAQARQVRFGQVLLTAIVAVFFGIGWLAGRVFLAAAFAGVAVKVGWQAGAARSGPAPAR